MAGNDDILGKADALLRRSAGTPPGSDTGAVPVLTDFVDVAGSEDATVLAGEVSMQVMATVEAQLAADIERRVSEQLSGSIKEAVACALEELRPTLADAVAHAVAEALENRKVK
jgi:hypothetical protein